MIEQIKHRLGDLRLSEAKVAEVILQNPDKAVFYSVKQLANIAQVSEPTVMRFCHAMGMQGYTDFKVKLAQSLGADSSFVTRSITADEPFEQVVGKMVSNSISELKDLRHSIDITLLNNAVTLLHKAKRIELYGQGASGLVAKDAQHKLFRVGVPVIAYNDSHVHCMSATTLSAHDAVIAISHTGRSQDIITSSELAKKAGAKIISITAARSPLANIADIAIYTFSKEDTFTYIPMTSRINDLQIIDMLAVGLALKKGKKLQQQLMRSKQVLFDKHLIE